MQKFNLKSRVRAVREDQLAEDEKLSEVDFKIRRGERDPAGSSRAMKTLAGARWHEMGKVKEELKAMLPTLSPSDVRRFHLPPHEAIIDELEENGYEESAKYMKELFELDEETRTKTDPFTLILEKPRLRKNKDAMMRLKEGLIISEQAKKAGDPNSMAMVFLDMALFFQAMTWEWWWVAERLYRSALMNAKLIRNDQRTIILIRYLLGRFLFEKTQDTAESLVHLTAAREASQGKSWNASRITNRQEDSIFRECNVLLYKTLLVHAQQVDPDQPDVAVKACTEALARATESGHHEYMADALHELGRSQLRSGDVGSSLKSLSKLLALAKRLPDPEGICNAHLALARAYKLRLCNNLEKEADDEVNIEKHLRLFREDAATFGLARKLAQAHYCTGEYLLSKRRPDIASPHLEMSFNRYNELGLHDDADKARAIAGISKGQRLLDRYIDLVLRCGLADQRAISMLCQWKNRRCAFWTERELRDEMGELGCENPDETGSPPSPSTLITYAANVRHRV